MKSLKDFNFKNKRVLVRCDFNVPLDIKGNILCDFKIKQTIPTIEYLIKNCAKVILMSHLGRPSPVGKILNPKSEILKFSLKSVVLRLEELLKKKIIFVNDCTGIEVKKEIQKLKSGEIILLENLRFYKEEEKNNENFAKEFSKLAVLYINDAFGASHRAHSSIVGVPKYLPSCAGFLLEKEIKILTKIIENPKLPLVAIFGGKEGNFKVIDKISEKANFVLINWLVEKEIKEKNIKLKEPKKIIKAIDKLEMSLDIGEKTILLFKEKIFKAKTIFWSGPLGQIEKKEFSKGTEEIAMAIIKSQAFSVIGGGDTISFINKLGLASKISHLSTGGNAMLEFLSGEKLPGIEALKNAIPILCDTNIMRY